MQNYSVTASQAVHTQASANFQPQQQSPQSAAQTHEQPRAQTQAQADAGFGADDAALHASGVRLSAQGRRREVKAIARDYDAVMRLCLQQGQFTPDDIAALGEVLTTMRGRVALLRSAGLSDIPPPAGTLRSVRSGAVMLGGAATRMAAFATAGTVGVVRATVKTATCPISTLSGAVEGGITLGERGARLRVGVMKPVTATGGALLGVVGGGLLGTVEELLEVPQKAFGEASLARSAFRKLDGLPQARMHTALKRMSSLDIAESTLETLDETIGKVGALQEHMRRELEESEGPTPEQAAEMFLYAAQVLEQLLDRHEQAPHPASDVVIEEVDTASH